MSVVQVERRVARVALDFDGCIAYSSHLKVAYAKEAFGVELTAQQTAQDVFPLGPEKYRQMMNVVGSERIDGYELAPHCKEVLEMLAERGFQLVVVTSRSDRELEAARYFVAKHKLPLTKMVNTNRQSKAVALRQLQPEALLEDSLWKLVDLGRTSLALYFLKQPWNEHEQEAASRLEQIISVENWLHFHECLVSNAPEQRRW